MSIAANSNSIRNHLLIIRGVFIILYQSSLTLIPLLAALKPVLTMFIPLLAALTPVLTMFILEKGEAMLNL